MRQRTDRKITSSRETFKKRPVAETVDQEIAASQPIPPPLTGNYPRRLAQKVTDTFVPNEGEVVVMPHETIIPWGDGYQAHVEPGRPLIVPRDVALNAEYHGQAKIVDRPEATRPRQYGRVASV